MVRILVPLAVLDGETIASGAAELLAPAEVVLLGYYEIPEQTAPGQARMTFEEKAHARLDDATAVLEGAGATDVTATMVFTPSVEQSIERVATEETCDAICYLNPAAAVDRLLVTLHGDVDAERIGRFVGRLLAGRDLSVTFLEVIEPGTESRLLDRARVALEGVAVDPTVADERVIETEAPVRTIGEVAEDYDATVVGEKEATLAELLFGDYEERIAAAALGPVLVVRAADGHS